MATSTPTSPVSGPNASFVTQYNNGKIATINNLTLANGMTAGWGDNDGNTHNPLPLGDYNLTGIDPYGHWSSTRWPVQRLGIMRNILNMGPVDAAGNQLNYSLYFIFNPNEIQVQFQVNTGNIPPQYLYGPGSGQSQGNTGATATGDFGTQAPVASLASAQSISWSLLFDRTYDMLYGNPGDNPDLNRGVLKDVAALYNLMGTFQQFGYPASYPVEVVFGVTADSQVWGFTGFITQLDITYPNFRRNMIPSRAQVDLGMSVSYIGPQVPGSGTTAAQSGAAVGQLPTNVQTIIAHSPPNIQAAARYQATNPSPPPPAKNTQQQKKPTIFTSHPLLLGVR
jgi:hypothetical protein